MSDELRRKAQELLQQAASLSVESGRLTQEAADILGRLRVVEPVAPTSSEPEPLVPDVDLGSPATYRTTRLTSNQPGSIRSHGYSTRQAFNANEEIIHLTAGSLLVDRQGNRLRRSPVGSEYNWSATEPNIIYGIRHVNERRQFVRYDLTDDTHSVIFTSLSSLRLGDSQGNLPYAGDYVVLDTPSEILVVNTKDGRVRAQRAKEPHFNWASVTNDGQKVMIVNTDIRQPHLKAREYVTDLDLNTLFVREGHQHGDIVTHGNTDYFASLGFGSRWNLTTGDTEFLDGQRDYSSGHLSGRGPEGIVAFSLRKTDVPGVPAYSVGHFPLMDGIKEAVVWDTIPHSGSRDYAHQMKATMSPSGSRIIYTSDHSGLPQDYMIERQV